jgi:hypothetical protein
MKTRPFGLVDAMILVVAVAAGLLVNRVDLLTLYFASRWSNSDAYYRIEYALWLVLPHVVSMTVALVAMRIRQPRPPFRRLARQPGAVACMVASATLLLIACWIISAAATNRVIEFSQSVTRLPGRGGHGTGGALGRPFSGRTLTVYADRVGFAVAGAWLSLLLAGSWRPEPTWIDRFGRAIAWLWFISTVVLWFRSYLL